MTYQLLEEHDEEGGILSDIDRLCIKLLDRIGLLEKELWAIVVVALAADILLTAIGLQYGLHEANPVMHAGMEAFGIAALGVSKIGVLAVAGAVRLLMVDRHGVVVPLGIGMPSIGAVLVNTSLLVSI